MKLTLLISTISTCVILLSCGNDTQSNPTESSGQQNNNTETEHDTAELISDSVPEAEFNYDSSGFVNFELRVYVNDPDPNGPTNVRDKPNGKIIQKLPKDDEYMMILKKVDDGWFEFSDLVSFNDYPLDKTSGWIHHSVLGATTRNYGNQEIPVYKHPAEKDEFKVGEIKTESSIRILSAYFDFVKVTCETCDGAVEGWISNEWICGNPVTTCP